MEKQTTIEQVVDAATRALKKTLYHVMPGAVVQYSASTQTATVQPMLTDPRVNPDTGAVFYEPWDPMLAVPIMWLRAGGFTISGPMIGGDPVLLLAWDLDPSAWLAQGAKSPASTQAANPADVGRHAGKFWTALPLNIFGPIADAGAAGGALVVGKDGDAAQIRFAAGSIQLGNTGGDFVALASKVLTQLGNIVTAFNSHVHPVPGVTSGGSTTTSSPPGTSMPSPGSVASSLVAAQ